MIDVADFNGFVQEVCCLICQDNSIRSNVKEGAAGTVTQEQFLKFVREASSCVICLHKEFSILMICFLSVITYNLRTV